MKSNIESHLKEILNPIIFHDLLTITKADLPWEAFNEKTILITGGSGFLANYLVQSLLMVKRFYGLNIKIQCVVRNMESATERFQSWAGESNFHFFCHDISMPLPGSFPVADFIIHSASQASPKYYGTDPVGTLKANSIGTMHLLDHAVKCSSQKFLFFSSGEVYGELVNSDKEIVEIDYGYVNPMLVRSCYAESKRVGESMCVSWSQQYNLHTNVVRPFHTYGPGMALDDGRVFADFVADVVARRDIVLKSDGLAKRPFCYISDATLGFFTVLLKGANAEAYNVANPSAETSIRELANVLANLYPENRTKVISEKRVNDRGYLNSSITRQRPSIEKISKLGWLPNVDIAEGFHRSIQSYLYKN